MNSQPHRQSPSTLVTKFMRPQNQVRRSDPADYGTAFGLDLSMEYGMPQVFDPSPISAAKAAPQVKNGWLARWRRRA